MASWGEIETAEPEFVARVRERLDAGLHKTIATLRADGAPRISGIETFFAEGELWFGSMPGRARRSTCSATRATRCTAPRRRPGGWLGEAKFAGRAEEILEPERRLRDLPHPRCGAAGPDAQLFRADIDEMVLIGLNEAGDRLVIEHWHEGRGVQRVERE